MRWLWKKSVDDEVSEELELHLEMRTREYIARGMDPRSTFRGGRVQHSAGPQQPLWWESSRSTR